MYNVYKNFKGSEKVITTSLKDIEKNVNKNSSEKQRIIEIYKKDVKKLGLKKGRVRPRNKTEQKILDSFERK